MIYKEESLVLGAKEDFFFEMVDKEPIQTGVEHLQKQVWMDRHSRKHD